MVSHTSEKSRSRKFFTYSLVGLLFLVVIGGWLVFRKQWWTGYSHSTGSEQFADKLEMEREKVGLQTSGYNPDGEKTEHDHVVLPSPFDDFQVSPYEKGSLVYAVDMYLKDEAILVEQIKKETLAETILKMSDWNGNYYKLVIPDADPGPNYPSSLKMIIYGRRFAKLMDHGHRGMTSEDIAMTTRLLRSDLSRWRKLWSEGQRIRARSVLLHSNTKPSDELIVPLAFRINTMILFAGAFSLQEALPLVLEAVEVFGEETNWSAAGYACDKILTSTEVESLGPEQRRVLEQYQAWKTKEKEKAKILEYKTVTLPSFDSLRRPFDRSTSLGAAVDSSTGEIIIEIPPQYRYIATSLEENGKAYCDPTGKSAVLKKVVDFAKAYSNAKP